LFGSFLYIMNLRKINVELIKSKVNPEIIRQYIIENSEEFIRCAGSDKQTAIHILITVNLDEYVWSIFNFEEDKDNESIVKMIASVLIKHRRYDEFLNLIDHVYIKRHRSIRRSILVEASRTDINPHILLNLLQNFSSIESLDNNNILELVDFWLNLIQHPEFIHHCLVFHSSRLPRLIFEKIQNKLSIFRHETVPVENTKRYDFRIILEHLEKQIKPETKRLLSEIDSGKFLINNTVVLVDVGNRAFDSESGFHKVVEKLYPRFASPEYLLVGHDKHFTSGVFHNILSIPNRDMNDDIVILYLSLKYHLRVMTNDVYTDHFIVDGTNYIKLNEIWNDYFRIGIHSEDERFIRYFYQDNLIVQMLS
jgi:hypothetical protein